MIRTTLACVAVAGIAGSALADDVVFQNSWDNGFFTPFDSSTSSDVRYGDSGWLGDTGGTFTLNSITLGLATTGGTFNGTTDISFSLHEGDPSGLVFGSGAELYSTTITGVSLVGGTPPGFASGLMLTIELPNIETLGGFNNIGWSVGVDNFNFDGEFGFLAATASSQSAGFYTNNASFYDGSSWSLFSFGADPNTGVANFVATITTPAPGAAGVLALAGLAAARCRR